ncbi:alpha/beta fold hydrolase [Streptomyces sp. 130]|uniref:thioesterase II family protein n=1 Tax=Streptomyces sp. 130 TaxID=2591006 RepID=UPI00117FECCA|nr:alpha/beta fold hydrolase [Streptomyces sp. 130]TRV72016.1 alpha/beta fold hydrolase [Streptomyces sp. 130]
MGTEPSRPVIVLVPPSCCGAGYFHRLRRALPAGIDVVALELPGHGRRHAQEFVTSAPAVVADALARLDGRVDVVYGESLGAYVGLALAAALGGQRRPALVAASNVPPGLQRVVSAEDVASPRAAAATLASMGGAIPGEVLDDPRLLAGAFPMIRADLLLSRSFVELVATTTVPGDVTVVAGEDDRSLTGLRPGAKRPDPDGTHRAPSLAYPALAGWARHTTGRCGVELLPGGHLLSESNPSGVAGVLLSALNRS